MDNNYIYRTPLRSEQINKIIELHKEGFDVETISKHTKLARTTVLKHIRKYIANKL